MEAAPPPTDWRALDCVITWRTWTDGRLVLLLNQGQVTGSAERGS